MHVPRKSIGLAIAVVVLMLTASAAYAEGPDSVACGQTKVPGCVLTTIDGINVYFNSWDPSDVVDEYKYGYKWQCVELIQRYYGELYGYPGIWAPLYAYQTFDSWGHPDTMTAYANGSATAPEEGDVLVFDAAWNDPYGHVGLVKSIGNGEITFVQQNVFDVGEDTLPINSQNVIDTLGRYSPIRGWLHDNQRTAKPRPTNTQAINLEFPELIQLNVRANGQFRLELDGRSILTGSDSGTSGWLSVGTGPHTAKLYAASGSDLDILRDATMSLVGLAAGNDSSVFPNYR